jgi:hypothetical protein
LYREEEEEEVFNNDSAEKCDEQPSASFPSPAISVDNSPFFVVEEVENAGDIAKIDDVVMG